MDYFCTLLCLLFTVVASARHENKVISKKCQNFIPVEERENLQRREAVTWLPNGLVNSTLWLDQHDYKERIRQYPGLTRADRDMLTAFAENGWFRMKIDVPTKLLESLQKSLKSLFIDRPSNVAYVEGGGKSTRMSEAPHDISSHPGIRFPDAHTAVPELRELSAHPDIHRMMSIILQDAPVVTQSLYFPMGSDQPLHRDPWYVKTTPIENMVAAWIPLEDIHPDSGPLSFVPGSHRLSWHPFTNELTEDIIFDRKDEEHFRPHLHQMHKNINWNHLNIEHFTPKIGEILIWHSGLVHGGSEVKNKDLTRKSFVIHFDKLRFHPTKVSDFVDIADCDHVSVSKHCSFTYDSPLMCGKDKA